MFNSVAPFCFQTYYLFLRHAIVCGAQCPGTLIEPGPTDPKRPGPRAGPSPRESLLVCWARAQGSVGRAPYTGVYNKETRVGGHRPVASHKTLEVKTLVC